MAELTIRLQSRSTGEWHDLESLCEPGVDLEICYEAFAFLVEQDRCEGTLEDALRLLSSEDGRRAHLYSIAKAAASKTRTGDLFTLLLMGVAEDLRARGADGPPADPVEAYAGMTCSKLIAERRPRSLFDVREILWDTLVQSTAQERLLALRALARTHDGYALAERQDDRRR